MNHIFCGKHVLAEFYGIELPRVNQKELEACVQAGCEKAGAHIVDIRTACFSNGGYTLVALLKESHIEVPFLFGGAGRGFLLYGQCMRFL